MKIYQHLLPRGTKQYWQWGETLGISVGALLLSYSIMPGDPLNTHVFPWIWMAPVLIALRYGVLMGVVSVLIFLGGWILWAADQSLSHAVFPRLTFLGGTLMVMISGEYSSVWITRARRIEELQHYTEQRLELLTRRLYLLSLSHDRLEQDLIGRPASLREGLKELNRILPADHGLPGAALYLALVVRQCNLSVAAVHAVENDRINPVAEASIGAFTPIDQQDPLIAHCISSGELVHINTEENLTELPSRYLVAVPAKTADGRIVAIMVVEKMPFFALQTDNMQTLSVLTSYYADTITASEFTPYLTDKLQDCPIDFFKALYTLRRLQRDMQISSMLVGFAARNTLESAEQLKSIANAVRGLDETWTLERGDWRICLVLLPLARESSLSGYLDRIERNFVERFGTRPGQSGIATRSITLDTDAISEKLDEFIMTLTENSHAAQQ
ncbi:MAG: PelD GGDEF domain-containing protein [Sulfuriferula sp.]|nr:PelD GGDEF domain-containing protein [Sulfuriferula sp.]